MSNGLRQVGEYPDYQSLYRRTIRAPVNPLDKSTVISIYPKEIYEKKHTIFPGEYRIPPGTFDNPAILVVEPSSWWRDVDEKQPLLEIPISSIQIADSIVKDYCNGIIESNMGDTMPGVFYIPGALTVQEIKTKHKPFLEIAKSHQNKWYHRLVKIADALWARSNGNPLSIPDEARLACKELQLNRPWLADFQIRELIPCVACGALRNPDFPVCRECKAIADPVRAKELGLVFAS